MFGKLKIILPPQDLEGSSEELAEHSCSGAFRISKRKLGKGSQGQLYASIHEPTMKIFAVKKVRYSGDTEIKRELGALVDLCRFANVSCTGAVNARKSLLRACKACCGYGRYEFIKGCIWVHVAEPNVDSNRPDMSLASSRLAFQPVSIPVSEFLNLQTSGYNFAPVHQCPYVVQFFDSFPTSSPESQCFVMEYMGLGSLKGLQARGRDFTIQESAVIAYSILHALMYINSNGYIHGDIKPSSVLLDASGGVKLSDFGSACKMNGSVTTRHRQTTGSMAYMPPEFFEPERGISEKSDIWSLGVLILHLLCSAHPFIEARNYWSMREAILDATFASMLGDNTYTPTLEAFIELCLKHNVAERAGAEELLHSRFLQHAATQGTVPAASPATSTVTSTLYATLAAKIEVPRLTALSQEEKENPQYQSEEDIVQAILNEH